MHHHPTALELLEAVRDFLEQRAMPALEGRNAFHARVAVNALDIVRRELQLGNAAATGEQRRLENLLQQQGEVAALDRELCRRIRDGSIALDDPRLVDHLWQTVLDTLAIDQPKYATYEKARPSGPR